MKKRDRVRLSLILKYGAFTDQIAHIPDYMYNKLRYRYHQGLPASFYLLFNNIPGNNSILKNILFSDIFEGEDYHMITADLKVLGTHTYLVKDGDVYDIEENLVTNEKFYDLLFEPTNKTRTTKESIESYKDRYKIGKGRLDDSFNTPLYVLDDINEQYQAYDGSKKELLNRQVNSYFDDINYHDGILIEDIKRLH